MNPNADLLPLKIEVETRLIVNPSPDSKSSFFGFQELRMRHGQDLPKPEVEELQVAGKLEKNQESLKNEAVSKIQNRRKGAGTRPFKWEKMMRSEIGDGSPQRLLEFQAGRM